MEHPLTHRLFPLITVGALALTVVACRPRSSSDSTSANDEYLAAVAELEGLEPSAKSGSSAKSTPKVSAPQLAQAPKPSEAVMTPFPYQSANDAPWPELFNDSNKYQYPFAEKFGIDPIHNLGQAYYTRNPIVKITSGKNYVVEPLTHSLPYLVPKAEELLSDIGADFIAKLKNKGVHGWRIIVTSLLRTPATVKKLRRVNINATDSSAHQFATTFDLAYLRFQQSPGATPTSDNLLKQTLAETLFDFRKKERCMVKYEVKTHCFHITVTK